MTTFRPIAFACTLAVALLAAPIDAGAADAVPTEKDPVAAERAVRLGEKLRCLVCQNQTIGDSNAELAVDLRRQVREQIAAGKSDTEIIDYMVTRSGDFVLYQPPVQGSPRQKWQKAHVPNLTGTDLAYRPPGHTLKGGQRAPASGEQTVR